jgi:hypothetical protein
MMTTDLGLGVTIAICLMGGMSLAIVLLLIRVVEVLERIADEANGDSTKCSAPSPDLHQSGDKTQEI